MDAGAPDDLLAVVAFRFFGAAPSTTWQIIGLYRPVDKSFVAIGALNLRGFRSKLQVGATRPDRRGPTCSYDTSTWP